MHNTKGFSLIEVIIVLVVIGILAAIATPAIMEWMPNIRFRGASQDLFGHMQLAKMEAIKRSANVVVIFTPVACPGLPNAVPAAGGSYTIFVDDGGGTPGTPGNAGNNVQNAGEATLVQQTMPANVALCAQTFPGAWSGFQRNGLAIAGQANAPNNTVTVNNDRGRSATLTLTPAGGIRIQ